MKLTAEELEKTLAITTEASQKAADFRNMFSQDTRGLMVFMAALEMLKQGNPGIFDKVSKGKALMMIAQWIAAGEPDRPGAVPDLLLKRFGPEAFHEIEKELIH